MKKLRKGEKVKIARGTLKDREVTVVGTDTIQGEKYYLVSSNRWKYPRGFKRHDLKKT